LKILQLVNVVYLLKQARAKVTTTTKNLKTLVKEMVPGIDMALLKIEAEEDGDGDSNCSADKAGELFSSLLELASDQREIVILEDNEDMLCDSPHNMIEVKRGLAPEVKVS
jgi:hypothetical protein